MRSIIFWRTARRPRLAVLRPAGLLLAAAPAWAGDQFRIGIMQAQKGEAEKFAPLENYLRSAGIEVQFVETADYSAAARMFAERKLDGMFSGSGVAGSMLIKDVAYPLVRPVSQEGHSTYWAAMSPRRTRRSSTMRQLLQGEKSHLLRPGLLRRILSPLPSGAENAAGALFSPPPTARRSKTWRRQGRFRYCQKLGVGQFPQQLPGAGQTGNDPEQNPDGTLIVSTRANRQTVGKVAQALLALQGDSGPAAAAVRDGLGISGYIITSAADFKHTLQLLRNAGVGPDFPFHF